MKEKIRDNGEKVKQNKVLPYLVGNVVEVGSAVFDSWSHLQLFISYQILDVDPEVEEDGANQDLDSMRKGKCAVIKTSTRQTVFLPLIGLVPAEKLTPGDLIGVNKDSYLVLDTLPAEFDNRVKAMEVDERPTETYTDIGGLEKQIEELVEAIVLPMEQADKFKTIGIKPPKGCLMYGAPGVWCFLAHSGYLLMTIRNWENPACACMRCLDESMLLEACWTFASTDVYW
jgi:26S proteasome regulatory subunit T5